MSFSNVILQSLSNSIPLLYDTEITAVAVMVNAEIARRGLHAAEATEPAEAAEAAELLRGEPEIEVELSPSDTEYADSDPPDACDTDLEDQTGSLPGAELANAGAVDNSDAAELEAATHDAWASVKSMREGVTAHMMRCGFRADKSSCTISKYTREIEPLFYGSATYDKSTGAKLKQIDPPFAAPVDLFKPGAEGLAYEFCKKRALANLECNGHREDNPGFNSRVNQYARTYIKGFEQLKALEASGKAPLGATAHHIFVADDFPQQSPTKRARA